MVLVIYSILFGRVLRKKEMSGMVGMGKEWIGGKFLKEMRNGKMKP
jgi:hypothetical protein